MALHLTKQLKRAIQDDPSKCVLFVGAGLSASGVRNGGQGLPDWNTLIKHMIDDLRDSENCDPLDLELLEALVKDGQHLDVAREFKRRTRPDQFTAFLRAELDPPDVVPSKIHEVILKTKFRGIITTNFDVVFEFHSDVLDPLVYPQFLEDPSTIQRENFLAKIHGCIRRTPNPSENLILTKESYTALRSDRRYQALMNVFLLGYRMLTVGFSLHDPDFLGLISDLREVFGNELPTIYSLMLRPDQKARDEWRKKGIEIIPYQSHGELLGFFEEMLRLSETKYPVPTAAPVPTESEVNYDALLEQWKRAQKVKEMYEIVQRQIELLPNDQQREYFLFQLVALSGKQDEMRLTPHLVALGSPACERVLASLFHTMEGEDRWYGFSPHPKYLSVHAWALKNWPEFADATYCRRTFAWLVHKEWPDQGIDLWDVFVSLLNRIASSKKTQMLDDLYDVCEHIEGARERIEKIVFAPGFIREEERDRERPWNKSWDEQVVEHVRYEKFKTLIRSSTIPDYNVQLAEASKQGYTEFVVERLLESFVHHTHLTLHSSSGLYDPDKASEVLDALGNLKQKDEQLGVLWAINRWPEKRRGLLSLGEDTLSLRRGLFIPLWWKYSSDTRIEYLKSHKHGKMHELVWDTGQEFLLQDMMGLTYDIDQDFRNAFNASLEHHVAPTGMYKYEPRPFEEIWQDRELTYRFSDEVPPELVRRIAVNRVDWENSQPSQVRWQEAMERAGGHLENRNLDDFISAEHKNYVIDNLLGAYFPSRVEVVLYPRMISYAADTLRLDEDALSTVVYIHETVHAFSHIGRDHDGRSWSDFSLPMSDQPDFEPSRPHEAIAQYYTYKLLEFLNDGRLLQTFLTLEQNAPAVYRVWRSTESYSLEEMRKILIEYRKRASEWPPTL